MRHSKTLPALLATIASRRAFLKRVVVMGTAIPVIGSVLAACGSEDADDDVPAAASDTEPTATAASDSATEAPAGTPTSTETDATAEGGTATTAASPTALATATQPPPAPASGQLAFFGAPEGATPNSVYVVGSDGAGPVPVWGWPTVESYAVYLEWSPDGRQLAFFGHDAGLDAAYGGYSALFLLYPEQGQTTNLNFSHLRDVGFLWGPPTWSPDGQLLYVSLPPPSTVPEGVDPYAIAGILAIPVDISAAPTQLITLQDLGMQTPSLRVSPDGQTIAALVGEPPQLVVVRVDDPQMRVEVGELPIGGFPVWSPDSRQLAFIGLSPDGIGQLYVVNADGAGLSQLTDHQPPDGVVSGGDGGRPRLVAGWAADRLHGAARRHAAGVCQCRGRLGHAQSLERSGAG